MKKVEIHPEAVERVKKFTITDNNLGFGKHVAPVMIQAIYDNGQWQRFDLLPYAPLQLDPCTKVFHYGQEIFEGMKAFRQTDDQIKMFRPEQNARRFNQSARRMSMAEIPEDQFLHACDVITAYCKHLVPKRLGESLYLRPFMIATEVGLGIKPSKQFLFVIIASPSGAYFSGDSVKVYIERDDIRAAHGGIGFAKTGGNYAASLQSYTKTIDAGCDQTMWLDETHQYIEEMSGMNFMCIIDGELHTPAMRDTILDGITRRSILDIARAEKIKVIEETLSVDFMLKAIESGKCTEAFVCGTASVICPINSFLDKDKRVYSLKDGNGKIAMQLREKLIGIQAGRDDGPEGWMHAVPDINF
ncbi:MAG: branched-chain amino acid aminotransferase [Bdellovibrionales bacterium]|nr:branched-chain amino acid aminotransferase [Bdellovibrionales bacterium]